MKKIKNIRQIKEEKKRLKERSEMLEKKIRNNWVELKEQMRPSVIAGQTLGSVIRNKAVEGIGTGNVLKDTLSYGVTLLATKLLEKTGEKMASVFRKRKRE